MQDFALLLAALNRTVGSTGRVIMHGSDLKKQSSIRCDACMTADYARGQPASAWPLAGQPCKVDCDLHTIARAHNRPFDCSPIGTIGPRVAAVV